MGGVPCMFDRLAGAVVAGRNQRVESAHRLFGDGDEQGERAERFWFSSHSLPLPARGESKLLGERSVKPRGQRSLDLLCAAGSIEARPDALGFDNDECWYCIDRESLAQARRPACLDSVQGERAVVPSALEHLREKAFDPAAAARGGRVEEEQRGFVGGPFLRARLSFDQGRVHNAIADDWRARSTCSPAVDARGSVSSAIRDASPTKVSTTAKRAPSAIMISMLGFS